MADIDLATVTTSTTSSMTTDYAFTSVGGALRRMSLGLLGQLVGFLQGGTSPTLRRMQDKIREAHISVMDFGATRGTTTAPSTASDTAFDNALAWAASTSSLCNKVSVPVGYFRLSTPLDIPPGVALSGCGKTMTEIWFYHTTANAAVTLGNAAADHNNDSVYVINGIRFNYAGTGTSTSIHGIRHTHTLIMDNCTFNNFPGCGMYVDTSWASPTTGVAADYGPRGSKVSDCIFSQNEVYGCWVRFAAYNLQFINCRYDSNAINGFRQSVDGGVGTNLRGTLVIGGQCSYNEQEGYMLLDGDGFQLYGAYAEYNFSPNRTGGTGDRYIGNPADFYFSTFLTNSWFNIGVLLNADTEHVRLPGGSWNGSSWSVPWPTTSGGSTAHVQIWEGGRLGYGAT